MFDWLDIPSLQDSVPLDIDRGAQVRRFSVWDTARVFVTANGYRVLTLVAEENGRVVALGQTGVRAACWHVVRLLMRSDQPASSDATGTLAALLTALAQSVGERGAQRLFAHIEHRAPAHEAFVRAGFVAYTYESVFFLPKAPALKPITEDLPLRPQADNDAWAIHQLYSAITPRVVQLAEGIEATYWEKPFAAHALQRVNDQRWVLDLDGEIVGYMRIGRLPPRIHLLIHPRAYSYARAMIAVGASHLYPARSIHCCLPEFQSELGTAFEEEGFRFIGTQVAMVKQLTAAVRADGRLRRPILEPTLGPARTVSSHSIVQAVEACLR